MKVGERIGQRERQAVIVERDGRLLFQRDGKDIAADAIEVAPQIYSILLGGKAFEVRVEHEPDGLHIFTIGQEYFAEIVAPRQWRRDGGKTAQAEGRQEIVAPMPGKIVRVLVKTGESVEAGQGLMRSEEHTSELQSPV